MSARPWWLVAPLAALLAVVALAGCSSRSEPGAGAVVERVAKLVAELEGDEAAATRAAAALAALGPADAAAVPTLMAAITCPPATAHAHVHDDHEHHAHDHEAPAADHGHTHEGGCNDHVILAAAAGLGAIGAASVPPLLAVLRSGDQDDRTFAGYAFAHMHPSAAPALIAALDDREPRLRLAAVGALRGMEPPPADARAALAGRLHDADTDVRAQAADALGHFGASAVPDLVTAFDDPDPSVRASAASALRFIGAPARTAARALVARLGDPAAAVRVNAAAALAAVGADDPASIAALTAALDDPDHIVRWGGAMALGRLGPSAASSADALTRAEQDVHPLVRAAASDALARVRGAVPR